MTHIDLFSPNRDRTQLLPNFVSKAKVGDSFKPKSFSSQNLFSDLMKMDKIKNENSRLSSISNELYAVDLYNLYESNSFEISNFTEQFSPLVDNKSEIEDNISNNQQYIEKPKSERDELSVKNEDSNNKNTIQSDQKDKTNSEVKSYEKDNLSLSTKNETDTTDVKNKKMVDLGKNQPKVAQKNGEVQIDIERSSKNEVQKEGELANRDIKNSQSRKDAAIKKDGDILKGDTTLLKEAVVSNTDLKKSLDPLKNFIDSKKEQFDAVHKIKNSKVKASAKNSTTNNSLLANSKGAGSENSVVADSVMIKELGSDSPDSQIKSQFSKYLKESGIDKIVKQAKIVLKDGNSGEIKLILKPEKLGTVKIKLNIDNNRIVGKIFVENSSVREAFKETLVDLNKALSENAFESASVDVSVSYEKSENQFAGNEDRNGFNSDSRFDFGDSKLASNNQGFFKPENSGTLNLVL